MKNSHWYLIWEGMFLLCAVRGFIPSPEGFLYGLCVALSVLFFLPPAVLLYRAVKEKDRNTFRRIRNLSLISLVGTVVLFIGNIFSVSASEAVGDVLYWLLILVSSPMTCARIWVLSLFLWACLLMVSFQQLMKKE